LQLYTAYRHKNQYIYGLSSLNFVVNMAYPLAIMKTTDLVAPLGARIRTLRKARKLTQEKLAEMAGLHPTYVGDIERGQVNASLSCYADIAEALGVPLSELINIQPNSNDVMLQNEIMIMYEKVAGLDEKRRKVFIEGVKSLLHTIESI
jgi:transcriptional regulator with XRE-family HTH domain